MMIRHPPRRRRIAWSLAIAVTACTPAAAQSIVTTIDCAALKLERASGVPDGPLRDYTFSGSCTVYHQAALPVQSSKPYHTFPVKAEGAWDAKTNHFRETITILGQFSYLGTPISGSTTSSFACSYDPVTNPTACNGLSHANATKLTAFSKAFESHTPILAGRATMAQATAVATPPRPPIAPVAGAVKEAMQPPRQPMAPVAKAVKEAMDAGSGGAEANAAPQPAPDGGGAGTGEIARVAGVRIVLESGRVLASDDAEGDPRWAILAADGETLRRFPAESRAYRFPDREIVVDWGGGVFRAGRERQARLKLPAQR